MRKPYKIKYKLQTEDQVSYYFECLFLLACQVLLCTLIFTSGELQPKFDTRFDAQFAMFFSNFLLHCPCVAIVRNGINMCKFVVFHHEEFSNPTAVFILGFMVAVANIYVEVTNAWSTLSQDKIINIISKFVGFKVMVQIQDYYLRQRDNFPVKDAAKEPLVIDEDPERIFGSNYDDQDPDATEEDKTKFRKPAPKEIRILYVCYKIIRGIFTAFYFYFFPLFYLAWPLVKLMLSGSFKD
jgi:hypothetical protein